MLDVIGWIATAVFSASYFFRTAATLRLIQALAAGLWIFYGWEIRAFPVVIANVIVAAAAVFSTIQGRQTQPRAERDQPAN